MIGYQYKSTNMHPNYMYVSFQPDYTSDPRLYNTHVILDTSGAIQGTYRKTHLFNVDIQGGARLKESDYTIPGSQIGPPVKTPVGNVGMAIVSFKICENS